MHMLTKAIAIQVTNDKEGSDCDGHGRGPRRRGEHTWPRTREKIRSMAVVLSRESTRWLSRHSLTKPLPSSSKDLGVPDLGVPPPKLANALKAASSSSSHPTSHAPCRHKDGVRMRGQSLAMLA